MLDIVYVAGIIAVFAIIALVARGVEKLGPRAGGSGHGEAVVRGEQGGPRARGSGHGEAMGGEERA